MSEKILIRDIPVVVELGDLCENVSMAYKVMVAIVENRYNDAFDLVKEMLNNNDTLIEANVSKEAIMSIIKREDQKYN